ncbi:bacteriocin-like protein [Elizabethkingia meningoseptica]|uniref:bacteriocin-like protein n=1 Tax=Elizabethkingia meningoseptica TaxID=238 RepID=UPI0030167BD0
MKNLKKLSRGALKDVNGGGACSSWISVTASCGVNYYLCADNYKNKEEVGEAVMYFDDAKC